MVPRPFLANFMRGTGSGGGSVTENDYLWRKKTQHEHQPMSQHQHIRIKGARVNNLKGIDVDIPRDRFVVITGVSGSGKSSLAFETLFAEGQRRFAESISSFARQFLGRMSKPDVESITGIPPAIAIEQKVNTRNPRSTVGTTTEIYDYLRVIFAKIGRTYSPISGEEVVCDSMESVMLYLRDKSGTLYLMADLKWEEEKYRIEKLLNLKEEGFSRVYIAPDNTNELGEVVRIDGLLSDMERYAGREVMLMVDRISLGEGATEDEETAARLMDSIKSAFEKGEGTIHSVIVDETNITARRFSTLFEADGLRFEKPQEWMFNFNSPLGACPVCGGLGQIIGIDEALVIPNAALSVYQDAIACWRGNTMSYFKEQLILNAHKFDFPIHTPYNLLTAEQKRILWEGNEHLFGINDFFKELEAKRYKIQNKYMISRYSGRTVCRECGGHRLKKEALYIKVGGKSIADLMDMNIGELSQYFRELTLTDYERSIVSKAINEVTLRLTCLENVGLSYLTLGRRSNTLSGGESQRVNLVSCLGNSLTGSMYVLDEPSIGLHQRDTQRLISVLKQLRDIGNTVIVVEHDEEIIRAADWLIDIGPHAGIHGGEIVYQGPPPCTPSEENGHENGTSYAQTIPVTANGHENGTSCAQTTPETANGHENGTSHTQNSHSLTLQYLGGEKSIPIPEKKRGWAYSIEVCGACENNLKNIDVKFPLRVMTAVVGVSGSGKSTLVGDILYPALSRHLGQTGPKPGAHRELRGDLDRITSIEYVDQNPIGKSSRSNPATYLKVYDDIRKLFSEQPYAKMNGYGHSHFSFNIDGGRCPECQGEGVIKIPMQFMADITTVCESCGGKRFLPDILEVKYKGKDINDILNMSVDEAIEFFSSQGEPAATRIAEKLKPLQYVGLNYVQLGQNSSTLSGGESQRVKLASFLGKDNDSKGSILFIFDEPTTGLHFDDISKLLNSFNALLDKGHTIIVVEHNPYIIEAADHIIELGPEGGDEGGYLCRG